MKIEVNSYDRTVTIGVPQNDVTISEWYDMFASCLIGVTFTQEQINNYIIDKANELSEDVPLCK
jgi:hypothetical protein